MSEEIGVVEVVSEDAIYVTVTTGVSSEVLAQALALINTTFHYGEGELAGIRCASDGSLGTIPVAGTFAWTRIGNIVVLQGSFQARATSSLDQAIIYFTTPDLPPFLLGDECYGSWSSVSGLSGSLSTADYYGLDAIYRIALAFSNKTFADISGEFIRVNIVLAVI